MRLYSRGQVIFFSFLSALVVALVMTIMAISGQFSKKTERAEAAQDGFADTQTMDAESQPASSQSQYIETQSAQPVSAYTDDERENISVYERLNAAVVNITTETVAYNWFLEPVPQQGGSGSGSIIDTQGHVLTNNHVIRNARRVYVSLADGSQYEGTVVGIDPENDLAVLKFDPPQGMKLSAIPFGDSGNLRVGQKVLAIGNPFALERTLTSGMVSGLGRPVQIPNSQYIVRDMIQTDASINPGNSGGPLLDRQGRMIGINTMIYTNTGSGATGIGFAIPVNTARRVVAELIQYGRVRRGWIDASVVQLFPQLVRYAKLPVSSGLLISRTARGGLAEKAGLRQGSEQAQYGRNIIYLGGDIITSIDGMKINSYTDLYSALENSKPGDRVELGIIRGERSMTLELQLSDREEVMSR